MKFVFSDGIAKAVPAMKLVSATPVTAGCRSIKSVHEIALMRLASQVTLQAYEAAWKSLREGMTQNDFAALVSAAHAGWDFQEALECRRENTRRCRTGRLTPQVIREGTILLIDGGCQVEGYHSDLSRTFVLGKPTAKMKQVFDFVHQAQTAARKESRARRRGAGRGRGGS